MPLAEFVDKHWSSASDTRFTRSTTPRRRGGRSVGAAHDRARAARNTVATDRQDGDAVDLELPFLLTPEEVGARRGFFRGESAAAAECEQRAGRHTLDGIKDPEDWRAPKTVPAALVKRGRELYRTEFPNASSACRAVEDAELEVMRGTANRSPTADVDVFRAFVTKKGDALLVRARARPLPTSRYFGIRPAVDPPASLVLRAEGRPAHLVTRAKDRCSRSTSTATAPPSGSSRASASTNTRRTAYALFDRHTGDLIESH